MFFNLLKKFIVDIFPSTEKWFYVNRGLDVAREEAEEDDRDDVMGSDKPRFVWRKIEADWEKIYNLLPIKTQHWMDCTGEAMANLLEALLYAKFKKKVNVSAAYINGMAGTSRTHGNSITSILKAVANCGWVTVDEWPEKNRWKKIPQKIINKGKRRIEKEYVFGYDRVYNSQRARKEAEEYSPLYTGGAAWAKKNGFYYSFGRANHCFLSIGSEPALNKAKDSYNPHIKKLAKNYQFFPPRRIYLEKRELEYNQIEINNLIKRGFEYVMRTDKPNGGKGQIYKLLKNGLKELTEQDKITEAYREFARRKDLTGISENNYYKLLK